MPLTRTIFRGFRPTLHLPGRLGRFFHHSSIPPFGSTGTRLFISFSRSSTTSPSIHPSHHSPPTEPRTSTPLPFFQREIPPWWKICRPLWTNIHSKELGCLTSPPHRDSASAPARRTAGGVGHDLVSLQPSASGIEPGRKPTEAHLIPVDGHGCVRAARRHHQRHTKTADTGGPNIWPLPAPGLGDVDIVVSHLVFIRPIAKTLVPPRLHSSATPSRAPPQQSAGLQRQNPPPPPRSSREGIGRAPHCGTIPHRPGGMTDPALQRRRRETWTGPKMSMS